MDGFDDPWEHIRLLSDRPRNEAMLELLRRHAPGRDVLEVGCGTGVLSCIAARLGARRVIAVEPSEQVEAARALVEANKLGHIVDVRHARIEELTPEPVDLAFSELLNAEPFAEGVLEVSRATAPWVRRGGLLAPRRLEVWCALVRDTASAEERSAARAELERLGKDHQLDFGPVARALEDPGPYAYLAGRAELASEPVLLYSADLLDPPEPDDRLVHTQVLEPGIVGGVAIWFRAELDEGLALSNAPGAAGHWGVQLLAWPSLQGAKRGPFALRCTYDGAGYEVVPG